MGAVAVTVGTFDGVHLGHRALLGAAGRLAEAANLSLVALTLDRHPLALLRPERAPQMLTGLEHKLQLLAAVEGVARVEVLPFDRDRADQLPEAFVADTLLGELGARLVVVGENFRFGRQGAGDLALATEVGKRLGVPVVGVPLLKTNSGLTVSSSQIRRLVAAGHLEDASALLDRPHEVRGRLRHRAAPCLASDEPADSRHVSAELVVGPDLVVPPPGNYAAMGGFVGSDRSGQAPGLRVTVQPPCPHGEHPLPVRMTLHVPVGHELASISGTPPSELPAGGVPASDALGGWERVGWVAFPTGPLCREAPTVTKTSCR